MGNQLERAQGGGSPAGSPLRKATSSLATRTSRSGASPSLSTTPTSRSPSPNSARGGDAGRAASSQHNSPVVSPYMPTRSPRQRTPSALASSSPRISSSDEDDDSPVVEKWNGGGDGTPRSASGSPASSRESSLVQLEPLPVSAHSSAGTSPSVSFHSFQSPFTSLPAPILARIFSRLSAQDLLRCSLVSKEWLVLTSMDTWWEELALRDLKTTALVSAMLHERAQLPHLTHGSWRELYFKYRNKENLARNPRVLALYDYHPRTDRELAVHAGEVLILLGKDPAQNSCWWLVQRIPAPSSLRSSTDGSFASGEAKRVEPSSRSDDHSSASSTVSDETSEDEHRPIDEKVLQTNSSQVDESDGNSLLDEENVDSCMHSTVPNETIPKSEVMPKVTGWVPSGYLELYHPPRKGVNRAIRSLASSGQGRAETEMEIRERNKKAPFMVRANYDYIAANEQELSFKKYDLMAVDLHAKGTYPSFDLASQEIIVTDTSNKAVLRRVKKGRWWKASLTRRSTTGGTTTLSGWIPADLVTEDVTHVVSLFDYYPASDEELPLKKGQRVAILATDESRKGWLYAQGNGRRGWLPENYVVDDDEP